MTERKYKIIDIKKSKLKVRNTFIPDDYDEFCWEGTGIYSDDEFSEDKYYQKTHLGSVRDESIPYTGKGRDAKGARIISDEIVIKMENLKKPEIYHGLEAIEIYPTKLKKDDMDYLININKNLKIKENVDYVLNEKFDECLFYSPQVLHRILKGHSGHEFYIFTKVDILGINADAWVQYENDTMDTVWKPKRNHTHMNYYLQFRVEFNPILKIIWFTFFNYVGGYTIRKNVSTWCGIESTSPPVTFQFKKDSKDIMIFLKNFMKILNMESHQFSATDKLDRKFDIKFTEEENCLMIDKNNLSDYAKLWDSSMFIIKKGAFLGLKARILQVIQLYNLK